MNERNKELESGDLPKDERTSKGKDEGKPAAQDLFKAYQRELGDEPTDTVREYLRSIGQHQLLSASQERELGRSVERWVQLKQIRAAFQEGNDRPPSTAEVAAVVFRVVASERDLVEALAANLGEDPEGRQLPELLSDDAIRNALDAPMKELSRSAVAAAMGMPDVDPAPRISALSKHVGLLPEHAITRLDFAARSEGNGHVDEATVSAETLDELDRDLERWWDSIERLGQDASDLLTKSNLRLVVSVARRYLRRGLPLLDLIQEGNLGLMRAVEKYDPHRGFKFSTYATWWIRQAVTRALADQGRTIRLPVHVVERLQQLNAAERKLMRLNDRDPTAAELAAELEWQPEQVENLIRQRQSTVSLGTPVGQEESTLEDFIQDKSSKTPDEIAMRMLTREDVVRALEELPPRLRMVLALRFGFIDDRPRTLEEVGTELGVTRERIRQLEKQALNLLRESGKLPPLDDLEPDS